MAKRKEKTSWLNRILGRDELYEEFDEVNESYDDENYDEGEEEEYYGDDEVEEEEVRNDEEASDLNINLIDKGKVLIAQAIVPGLSENEISIDLNREMLTITTTSNDGCVERDGDYLYEELSFGSFSRSILLPAEVEVEDAKADIKNGVLEIIMPKIDKAVRRKVSVKRR